MPFKLGNLSGDKIFLGNTEVTSAFLGTQQVYSSGPAAFQLGTVTSDNLSANLGNQTYSSTPGLYLNSNGTKLFSTTGGSSRIIVREYNLSTPYNISTISLSSDFVPTAIGNRNSNSAFSDNGMFLYFASNDGIVRQYSVSNAFSLSSTVSFVRQRDVSGDAQSAPYSLQLNNDGTKMYVLFSGYTTYPNVLHRLIEYNLSTAYNIGTASISTSYDVPYTGFFIQAFHFNNDGSKMFINENGVIQQYNLSTPYSLSTISKDSNNFNGGSGTRSFTFSADGTKLYIGDGAQNALVSQYTNTF